MHQDANLTLTLSRPRATYDHHLNKHGRPYILIVTYQVSGSLEKILKDFFTYMGVAAILVM